MKYDVHTMDELSLKNSFIHQIHPNIKVIITLIFILCVTSFDRYEILRLMPYCLYPMSLIILGDIPVKVLMKSMIPGILLIIGLGFANPIFDAQTIILFDHISIRAGWLSYSSLLFKGGLTILAALLLIGTTGINGISNVLLLVKFPKIFVFQLHMTYRYISLLSEEVTRTQHAYLLRSCNQKGIHISAWGSLLGQILIRTYDRSVKIFEAMTLRGFVDKIHYGKTRKLQTTDIVYFVVWSSVLCMFKYVDVTNIVGLFILGGK